VSVRIPWHATAKELELRLETLPTLRDVNVWYANSTTPGGFIDLKNYENESVCGRDQLAYVEFISDRGDVPMLVATTSPYSLITLNISEWRKGTKENVECSGSGLCNRDVGVCNCLDGFASSSDTKKEKFGEYGERGDCAFRHGGTKDECAVKDCTNAKTGEYYSGPAPAGSETCPVADCKECDEGSEHKDEGGTCECVEAAVRDYIVVSGAGYEKANGIYHYAGIYNGYAAYCKDSDLKPTDTFTVSKCGWNEGCGLLMWSSHWGWGIGCDGHHRYSDPDCKERDPTKCGWPRNGAMNPRPGYGSDPLPTIGPVLQKIVVAGAGYEKANGVYTFSGVYNGFPAYCKDSDLKPTDGFTIGKCGWNGGCGLVMWSSHWGWGVGCEGHHRYSDPDCREQDPTDCDWSRNSAMNPRPGYGSDPLPSYHRLE